MCVVFTVSFLMLKTYHPLKNVIKLSLYDTFCDGKWSKKALFSLIGRVQILLQNLCSWETLMNVWSNSCRRIKVGLQCSNTLCWNLSLLTGTWWANRRHILPPLRRRQPRRRKQTHPVPSQPQKKVRWRGEKGGGWW